MLAETTSKMNPLHGACEGGRVETVRVILEFVANDEAKKNALLTNKNGDGKTSWQLASEAKNVPILEVLKAAGDPGAKSEACLIS